MMKLALGLPCLHSYSLTLKQAGRDVQILQLQPPQCTTQQQRSELMAVVKSLDCTYHTVRADVLAEWPSALESPALQDELSQLQGGICHQSLLAKHSDVW